MCLGWEPMENVVSKGEWSEGGLSNNEPNLGQSTLEPGRTCSDHQHCLLGGVIGD